MAWKGDENFRARKFFDPVDAICSENGDFLEVSAARRTGTTGVRSGIIAATLRSSRAARRRQERVEDRLTIRLRRDFTEQKDRLAEASVAYEEPIEGCCSNDYTLSTRLTDTTDDGGLLVLFF